jgi:hypothetical protein
MDEGRELVFSLSVDEARECLALIGEERVQHDALHGFPNQTVHSFVSEIVRRLDTDARRQFQGLQDDEVRSVREMARRLAYRYPDEKVYGQLLGDLDELDEHWRTEHSDEPETGIEFLRRAIDEVRRAR